MVKVINRCCLDLYCTLRAFPELKLQCLSIVVLFCPCLVTAHRIRAAFHAPRQRPTGCRRRLFRCKGGSLASPRRVRCICKGRYFGVAPQKHLLRPPAGGCVRLHPGVRDGCATVGKISVRSLGLKGVVTRSGKGDFSVLFTVRDVSFFAGDLSPTASTVGISRRWK